MDIKTYTYYKEDFEKDCFYDFTIVVLAKALDIFTDCYAYLFKKGDSLILARPDTNTNLDLVYKCTESLTIYGKHLVMNDFSNYIEMIEEKETTDIKEFNSFYGMEASGNE